MLFSCPQKIVLSCPLLHKYESSIGKYIMPAPDNSTNQYLLRTTQQISTVDNSTNQYCGQLNTTPFLSSCRICDEENGSTWNFQNSFLSQRVKIEMVRATSSLPIFCSRASRVEPGPGSALVRAEPLESSQRLDPPLIKIL